MIKKSDISTKPLTDQELEELLELIREVTPIPDKGSIMVQITDINLDVIEGQEMVIPFDDKHFKFIGKRAINKKSFHFEEYQGLETTAYGVRIYIEGEVKDIILPNHNHVILSKGMTIGFSEGSLDFPFA